MFAVVPLELYLTDPFVVPQLSPEGSVIHLTVAFMLKVVIFLTKRGFVDVYVAGSGFVRFTLRTLDPLI